MIAQELERDWAGVDLADAGAVIGRALELYHPSVALASSFSFEDCILMDLLARRRPDARVFALDTGRLDPETYECAEAMSARCGLRVEWYFPQREPVEALERQKGLFSFRESVDNRRECCGIRKVEPLGRALAGLRAWMTGLRRGQGVTRTDLRVVEVDAAHGGIVKISPLAGWTLDQVKAHVREHKLPYNRLYDRGYTSIGCAPCTRAIRPGEDERAGRWWWENPEHKECGLHLRPGP
ncbi:MAG: phosphoadenylyl-sulfate reductase [Verrucomicrobia bacterium]|nr:phosphoadenylyl-sulfate reductase [Verrucomicrobiota bacterium]